MQSVVDFKESFAHLSYDNQIDWLNGFKNKNITNIGILHYRGNDFQHQSMVYIYNSTESSMTQIQITETNLVVPCIYHTVRTIISATWLNECDQFLFPKK